nr:MAG TPA: hypothetical protein [Caudoviricetes sp.]
MKIYSLCGIFKVREGCLCQITMQREATII